MVVVGVWGEVCGRWEGGEGKERNIGRWEKKRRGPSFKKTKTNARFFENYGNYGSSPTMSIVSIVSIVNDRTF